MNILNADLHCHSLISDGTLSPEALAQRARSNGVELWALTDHDEVGGQHRAMAAARAVGLPYLTGTEISVTFAGKTVHIVGLGFDPDADLIRDGLARTRGGRDQRARRHPRRLPRRAAYAPARQRFSHRNPPLRGGTGEPQVRVVNPKRDIETTLR